jgi:hypothetical protein
MAWVYKQGNNNYSASTIGSIAFTTQNNTVNSLMALGISYDGPSGSSSPVGDLSLTDSKGNTWTKMFSLWYEYSTNEWEYIAIFSAVNTQGTGNEKITVDISGYVSGNQGYPDVVIEEWTGNATSSVQDGSGNYAAPAYALGTQTLNGPTLTTTVNGDLIYVYGYDLTGYITAFTSAGIYSVGQANYNSTVDPMGDEYGVQTSYGAITPTFKITASAASGGSGGLFMAAVAFKPAAGGGANMVQQELWWGRTPYGLRG